MSAHEMIAVAHCHFNRGVAQQDIADLMGVNIGRVNEACKLIGAAVGLCKPGYRQED